MRYGTSNMTYHCQNTITAVSLSREGGMIALESDYRFFSSDFSLQMVYVGLCVQNNKGKFLSKEEKNT